MLCSKIKEKNNSKSPIRMKWCQSIFTSRKRAHVIYFTDIASSDICLIWTLMRAFSFCVKRKRREHKFQVISWRHDVRYHLVIYSLAFCTIYRCSSVQCSKSSVCTSLQRVAVHCKHEFSRAGFSVLFSDFRGKINVRTVWDISFMRSGLSVIYGVFSLV